MKNRDWIVNTVPFDLVEKIGKNLRGIVPDGAICPIYAMQGTMPECKWNITHGCSDCIAEWLEEEADNEEN